MTANCRRLSPINPIPRALLLVTVLPAWLTPNATTGSAERDANDGLMVGFGVQAANAAETDETSHLQEPTLTVGTNLPLSDSTTTLGPDPVELLKTGA